MIQTLDFRGGLPPLSQLLSLVPRAHTDVSAALTTVTPLVRDVQSRGSAALIEQAERFDGVRPDRLVMTTDDIDSALGGLDARVHDSLKEAIARVKRGSVAQVPADRVTDLSPAGATITQRWVPVSRVGLYVPGGKAVYPSSVVMNVLAAQAAGVSRIALASPAQKEHGGRVHPTILAAAALLGVTEVYAIGGAGAIGAFAYGVEDIGLEPVDVVTGPGNIYVAAAKRLVNGVVGIDAEAGTTEILILADDSANPRFIAADLISQAEHDEAAAAILITPSPALADSVREAVLASLPSVANADRVEAALSGVQSGIILVDSIEDAVTVSNAYGPEHLELHTRDNNYVLAGVRNAGAIFMGDFTPVSLGDYIAGSNHVLPTGGNARYRSGLGAYTFLRAQQVVSYTAEALAEVHDQLVVLAEAEHLPAHGTAATIRLES
ncbi:histidinol dehydrogenase [Lysinibacter sp. HNR]|uniref:histidinol dehydrogenase n=1 Tax=Lysinibacter sp. HNR TaxID=3031408 RepID=UPI002434F5B8|nr:histidinol dehydrogenase [Lysinibacter sp. HNR]WGD36241.1 histidinol dehydrogenase [Lysinibacter sp. HNR]